MKKVFFIDGGAGRVLAAIPALLKFNKLNPEIEWNVLIPGWDNLYWGIPELQDRTYNIDTKGVFDNIVLNADELISPEPYRLPSYFKQQKSLAQAFDEIINNTNDHSDLEPPKMVFSKTEQLVAKTTVNEVKSKLKKQKTIIVQPFGRGAKPLANKEGQQTDVVEDDESRSLSSESYLILVKKLATRFNVIFFGEPNFQLKNDTYTEKFTTELRQWSALIKECDYFVGVDSFGQHAARATGVPGTVIFGSTYPINTSYPDYFQIIEKPGFKKYCPIRIAGLDSMLANRLNEKTIDYTSEELDDIFKKICSDVEKKCK